MRRFLTDLLLASEKAAEIARACRKEKDLFQLLIEEKSEAEKNQKFAHDFKTLADVLIQETVRHDLGKGYPTLAANIQGEETNVFTNTLGETINVQVLASEKETSELLHQVLDQDTKAADLLAKQVHSVSLKIPEDILADLDQIPEDLEVNMDDLGIWIDPIDSTTNYIRGNLTSEENLILGDQEVTCAGLQVVTVLIGVFDKKSGQPVIGVINQPFARYDGQSDSWIGRMYWGISMDTNLKYYAISLKKQSHVQRSKKKIVLSVTENRKMRELLSRDYEILFAGGAGYKILCVALNFVDMYITQKSSTYKWDSCAGDAILRAMNGGCASFVSLKSEMENSSEKNPQILAARCFLKYHEKDVNVGKWSNEKGVLAFRNCNDLTSVLKTLN